MFFICSECACTFIWRISQNEKNLRSKFFELEEDILFFIRRQPSSEIKRSVIEFVLLFNFETARSIVESNNVLGAEETRIYIC